MCGSMVDIQSAAAEIRRGIKKIEDRKKPQGKNIMSASAHRQQGCPSVECTRLSTAHSASVGCILLPRVQTSTGQQSFMFSQLTVWKNLLSGLTSFRSSVLWLTGYDW